MNTSYQIPPAIQELQAIHQEYEELNALGALGLYIDLDGEPYSITPADAIPLPGRGAPGFTSDFLRTLEG